MEQMGESDSLFDSHVMITDWSGAGMDYGMGLEKPVLYIDVPPKGPQRLVADVGARTFRVLCARQDRRHCASGLDGYRARSKSCGCLPTRLRLKTASRNLREEWVFNLGSSAQAGAKAIADACSPGRCIARSNRPAHERRSRLSRKPAITRGLLLRWVSWFGITNGALLGLVGLRYLLAFGWPDGLHWLPLTSFWRLSGQFALLGFLPMVLLVRYARDAGAAPVARAGGRCTNCGTHVEPRCRSTPMSSVSTAFI